MDFQQADEKFKQLKARYQAGELTEAEFKSQLQDLMVQDEGGTWWMIGYETERWYRHDGTDWVQADPPGLFSHQEQPLSPAVQESSELEKQKIEIPATGRRPRKWALLEPKVYRPAAKGQSQDWTSAAPKSTEPVPEWQQRWFLFVGALFVIFLLVMAVELVRNLFFR